MKLSRRQILGSLIGVTFAGSIARGVKAVSNHDQVGLYTVDKNHPFFSRVVLVDKWSNEVSLACSWNAQTEMAEIFVPVCRTKNRNRIAVDGHGRAVRAFVHMPGCTLKWRGGGRVTMAEISNRKKARS